ncbi:glycosyltransferase family 9 protein [Tepidamorphus sp. 3E244]|uniref:glycosyltransferase family 9 protein n=1 Tax=Tepidamorphus sp. 3E244 TaxID=3385498 RepID=UPI0038FC4CF1
MKQRLRALYRARRRGFGAHAPARTVTVHADALSLAGTIEPKRILVVRMDGLGDFLLSLRAFAHLRTSFPDSFLELLVDPANADLAAATRLFDAVHPFAYFPSEPGGRRASDADLQRVVTTLNLGEFDVAIDMRHYGSTRRFVAVIPACFRAGFRARKKDATFDLLLPDFDQLPDGKRVHVSTRHMLLAAAVVDSFGRSAGTHPVRNTLPDLAWRGSGQGTQPKIVINPYSGRAIKNWPEAHYAELIRDLQSTIQADVAIFGETPDVRNGTRETFTIIPGVTDLGTRLPFGELAGVLCGADLYIGNDSGTTHLAAMLGVPTLAVMSGDVDAEVWRPIGERATVLVGDAPCAPCFLNALKRCPNAHACMTSVTPQVMAQAARDLLDRARAEPSQG